MAALCLVLPALMVVGCGGSNDTVTSKSDYLEALASAAKQARIQQLEHRVDVKKKQLQKLRQAKPEQPASASNSGTGADLDGFLSGLDGEAGLAIGSPGANAPTKIGGGFQTGPAWSTIKIPIAERVLRDFGGPSGISSVQADEIHRAITLSDNDAAESLFELLQEKHGGLDAASGAVGEMLREAGDDRTSISTQGRDDFSTYGQTEWSLASQYEYMAALAGGCVASASDRNLLLGEMGQVSGSDTYGLGSIGLPAKWKGGWGPGTDGRYLVRQMGVITVGGREVVVALAAIPTDGSFESGQSMATQIAQWAAGNLANKVSTSTSC